MRCINRFKVLALAIIFVSACARRDSVALVPSNAYSSTPCWINEHGDLEAFLVLAREGRTAVPYLISVRCLVDGAYSSDGEAVLHHLNTIRILDLNRSLSHSLPGVVLSDNLRSDQPVPSSDSVMYYFSARVKQINNPSKTIYVPDKVINIQDLGMTLERFLDLPRSQRKDLMKQASGSAVARQRP